MGFSDCGICCLIWKFVYLFQQKAGVSQSSKKNLAGHSTPCSHSHHIFRKHKSGHAVSAAEPPAHAHCRRAKSKWISVYLHELPPYPSQPAWSSVPRAMTTRCFPPECVAAATASASIPSSCAFPTPSQGSIYPSAFWDTFRPHQSQHLHGLLLTQPLQPSGATHTHVVELFLD